MCWPAIALISSLLLALSLASPLHAHDPYTSWTDARLHPNQLELTLTLSRANALRLIPGSHEKTKTLPPITPENFSTYTAKLKSAAPDLFLLSLGPTPLKFISATAKISGEDDIAFHLVYTLPSPSSPLRRQPHASTSASASAPAPKLRFFANYLQHLIDGHVGTIVATDAAGKDLDWSPVSLDQPTFDVTLPKPP